MSDGFLPLAEKPLFFLLRGVKGCIFHFRWCRRSPGGRLALACIGGVVAKRPLLAYLGKLAVKAAAEPDGYLWGGDGAVERPHSSEVRVVADSTRCHVALGERRATTHIALVVPRLLPPHVLRLRYDGPRARGTALTASSEVVQEVTLGILDHRRQLLLAGEAVAAQW